MLGVRETAATPSLPFNCRTCGSKFGKCDLRHMNPECVAHSFLGSVIHCISPVRCRLLAAWAFRLAADPRDKADMA